MEMVHATIADQPEIELVGEVANEDGIAEAVEEVRPDVLTLTMDESDKYRSQRGFLLDRYPEMRIVALAPQQNRVVFYWANVDIRSTALKNSGAGILNAMRVGPQMVGMSPIQVGTSARKR